jgi:NhaP-type Na+/H+ or K+/H+ antiporter
LDGALITLTNFVIIIVLGILLSIISKKLRISNLIFLMAAGMGLGWISRKYDIMHISSETMLTIAVLSLALIIFYGSSRFNIKSLDGFSVSSLKLTTAFLFFNMLLLGISVSLLFMGGLTVVNILYSIIFAIIVSGTDPASIFAMMKSKTNKVIEFLEIEAIINTPPMVILPLLILDIILGLGTNTALNVQGYFTGFLTQILVGIGSGIFVGIVFFKAMKKFYSEEISPLAIIASALLAYILAENLAGNGVLAVAVLGFVFGNIYVANKNVLQEFSGMISNSLEILVFILLGFIIQIQFDWGFILKSFLVFLLTIVARYLAVKIIMKKHDFKPKEEWFIILNMPKGIAVAVMVFSLSVRGLAQLETINNLIIMMMIYSLILSTVIDKMSHYFINVKIEE